MRMFDYFGYIYIIMHVVKAPWYFEFIVLRKYPFIGFLFAGLSIRDGPEALESLMESRQARLMEVEGRLQQGPRKIYSDTLFFKFLYDEFLHCCCFSHKIWAVVLTSPLLLYRLTSGR